MRDFDAQDYLDKKTKAINEFFTKNGLDSVVVGISGGVDSAVVLKLYVEAGLVIGSPIKQVRALKMPIHGNGVTGQHETLNKANMLEDSFKTSGSLSPGFLAWRTLDLTEAYNAMTNQIYLYPDKTDAWTDGQMASVLRTPMFYYQAAIMQAAGLKSIVSGTTNRDEGSYIGFFGKASDGMVDIQPIADIHKSEVYRLAELLGVPKSITEDEPKGDVWDGRNDEQMIGAPYQFLQKMIKQKCKIYADHNDGALALIDWNYYLDSRGGVEAIWAANIEKLHKTNKHKYLVGSPAHFIDVMERCVPGGWQSVESTVESYRRFAWVHGLVSTRISEWFKNFLK